MRTTAILCVCISLAAYAEAQILPPDPAPSPGPQQGAPRVPVPKAPEGSKPWMEPSLQSAEYRIGAEDLLSVTVLQASELNSSARVSQQGDVSLPLIGSVPAIGLTTHELEVRIEDVLRQKYIREPDVTVQVIEVRSHAISVIGAVERPGILQIGGRATLLEVLSLAGGLTAEAGDSIVIQRGAPAGENGAGPAHIAVKITTLLGAHDPAANVPIYPGDQVNVQSAAMVYVIGAVTKPGAFAMKGNEPLTVLRALALGEGLLPVADTAEAVVLRTNNSGGDRIQIPVNLDGVLKGKAPDVVLAPQDVVFVPISGGKVAARAAASFLTRVVTLRGFLLR